MPTPRDKILLRRSSAFSKRPALFDIEDGELALNFNSQEPGLYFRDFSLDTNSNSIRKIGPAHIGSTPPNYSASALGYPTQLSSGELWVDTSEGEGKFVLKAWNGISNTWDEVPGGRARVDLSLDQFLNGSDGSNIIHTDGIDLKINNKIALTGYSTTEGNKLIVNRGGQFGSGVELQGSSITIKDPASSSSFQIKIQSSVIPENDFVPFVIGEFDTNFRSAKYVIQVEGFTQGNLNHIYYVMESLVIHDGSEVFMTQYGTVSTFNNEILGGVDALIQDGKVKLTFQKSAGITGEVIIKTIRTCLSV